jgi:hypothetical protein
MLASTRPTHEFFNPKYDDTCVCKEQIVSRMHPYLRDRQDAVRKTPRPIEAIRQEFTDGLKARVAHRVGGWHGATKAASEDRRKLRDEGVFTHDPERQKQDGTRREQCFNEVGELLGEHLIWCCEKAGLQETFANFAARMQTVSDKFKAAKSLHGLGEASRAARHKAFEEAEPQHFRKDAYADEIADEQEPLEMQRTQDYNDVIWAAAGGANMRFYYL